MLIAFVLESIYSSDEMPKSNYITHLLFEKLMLQQRLRFDISIAKRI